MRETNVLVQNQDLSQVLGRGFGSAQMHLDIAQVEQRLEMLPLMRELRLEFAAGVFVALLLPIQVSQAKVDTRLGRRGFHRGFELRRRGVDVVGRIHYFTHEHVNRPGIRVFGE